jgi:nicotinate phosphoribosyltransferase
VALLVHSRWYIVDPVGLCRPQEVLDNQRLQVPHEDMSSANHLLLDGRALLDADRLLQMRMGDRRASFEIAFRSAPAHTAFLVVAGVETGLEMLAGPLIDPERVTAAQDIMGFSDELAERLRSFSPKIDVDSVSDGTIVFPGAPVAAVEGSFIEALLTASLLRSTLRRATAIATRTCRLHMAAQGDSIIDGSSAQVSNPEASLLVARAAVIGGASATTNVLAALNLGIPFRATSGISMGMTGLSVEMTVESWRPSDEEEMLDIGAGDDEEAVLLESKRRGRRSSGWLARGLDDAEIRSITTRCELVALEQGGSWAAPPIGMSGEEKPRPGRKVVARYSDSDGRLVCDIVHLMSERMRSPKEIGAVNLMPLANPRMREGRTIESAELANMGRERAIATRAALPERVTYLRGPSSYRVEESAGVIAQRGGAIRARERLTALTS